MILKIYPKIKLQNILLSSADILVTFVSPSLLLSNFSNASFCLIFVQQSFPFFGGFPRETVLPLFPQQTNLFNLPLTQLFFNRHININRKTV